jgi:ferredoxin
MKIVADQTRCIGAGTCVGMAPNSFDQDDDDGTVIVLRSDVPDGDQDAVRIAVTACPVGALTATD